MHRHLPSTTITKHLDPTLRFSTTTRRIRPVHATILAVFTLVGLALSAGAMSMVRGTPLTLEWTTVDGGGGRSTGGGLALTGTIAQHDANPLAQSDPRRSQGGAFELRGGFWPGPATLAPGCPADLDHNGIVDASDLAMLLGSWGPPLTPDLDLVPNGSIDAADLAVLLGAWGPCTGS